MMRARKVVVTCVIAAASLLVLVTCIGAIRSKTTGPQYEVRILAPTYWGFGVLPSCASSMEFAV